MATTQSTVGWLLSFLKPYKWQVIGAITALFVGAFSWLILGQGVRLTVDEGFVANNQSRLTELALWVLAISMLASIATYFRFALMTYLGERVSADIRKQVFAHLVFLNPDFFSRTRTGEVISRFTADTTVLQSVIGMGISMALRSSVTFIGALSLMLISSPQLTLYVLLAVPCVLLPIKLLGNRVRQYSRLSQDRLADIGAYVDESLHEIKTVQAYSHENHDILVFNRHVEAVINTAKQRIHYRALLIGAIMSISLIAVIIVAWIGAVDVINGAMSAGELTAFMFYAVLAGGSVATISEVIGEIQKAAGASERLIDLLSQSSHIETQKDQPAIQLDRESDTMIELRQVNFHYPSAPGNNVLKNVSMTVKRGQKIALVGPSGAGKSTLFQLLLRFYDQQQGQIIVQSHECQTLPITQLRQQFALVPQESVIFATSVIENIRYGRPNASINEVKQAAETAQAAEFIHQLNHGYDTNLGERGVMLSGGQKQRIAIARAILADRPILLLDEATSALDAVSEQQVKIGLDNLMRDKTTLIIAHRLSTVINADHIIVLQNGEIVASGDHNSLLQTNSLYRQHAELQLLN